MFTMFTFGNRRGWNAEHENIPGRSMRWRNPCVKTSARAAVSIPSSFQAAGWDTSWNLVHTPVWNTPHRPGGCKIKVCTHCGIGKGMRLNKAVLIIKHSGNLPFVVVFHLRPSLRWYWLKGPRNSQSISRPSQTDFCRTEILSNATWPLGFNNLVEACQLHLNSILQNLDKICHDMQDMMTLPAEESSGEYITCLASRNVSPQESWRNAAVCRCFLLYYNLYIHIFTMCFLILVNVSRFMTLQKLLL